MFKLREIGKFILVLCIGILLITGCSNGNSTNAVSNSNNVQQQSTLEKVLKTKKLTVAVLLSMPPFGFINEQGKPQGYDVDIANELANSLGAELEIIEVTAANRVPYVETGKCDLVIGCFTRTPERAQKINFTDPYVVAGQVLLVNKGSGIKSIEDLKQEGKVIAVSKGSSNGDIAKQYVSENNLRFFDAPADTIMALKNKQVDAVIEDSNYCAYQAKLNPEFEVVGDSLVSLEYNAFGVRKNDQEWLNYLNLFIFDLNKSGKNEELYVKWFGQKLPYNLNPQF